jgi:lipid-A-disaccharide synthase
MSLREKLARLGRGPAPEELPPVRRVPAHKDLRLFLVAGEHSGDALGGRLMAALNRLSKGRVHYLGVGGEQMEREGLATQFPMSDVAVMGPMSILPRLPRIVARVRRTAAAAVAADPDAVVIIDAPEFTHPIAKRIRRRAPHIPIIDYVSPSVWAWRPGRARKMRRYVDHLLALLPFEPEVHQRLGGPPCTYVGHPLVERLDWLRDLDTAPLAKSLRLAPNRLVLVVLPGSRTSEVTRLMEPFGKAIGLLQERGIAPRIIIPVVPQVRDLVEELARSWPIRPALVEGGDDKFRAFKLAHAALAASGTVTLELALSGTPMVVAYRVDAVAAKLRFLLKVPSVVLANLVLGENAFPEYLQEDCTEEKLSAALEQLLKNTPERQAQGEALAHIPALLLQSGPNPSDVAARIVLDYAEHGRRSDT